MPDAVTPQVIDFTNVKDRGAFNPRHMPAGDYLGKITGVVDSPTKEKKEPQWIFTVSIAASATASYPYRCQLQESTLWKIRNLFVAAGMTVPKKRVKVDPSRIVGKSIGITLEDHEYENKLSSEIVAVFPTSDLPQTEKSASSSKAADSETEEVVEEEADADGEVEEIEVEDL